MKINTKLESVYVEYLGYKHYKEKQFELITKIYDYLKEKYPEIDEEDVMFYYNEAIDCGYKSFKSIIACIEKLIKDNEEANAMIQYYSMHLDDV